MNAYEFIFRRLLCVFGKHLTSHRINRRLYSYRRCLVCGAEINEGGNNARIAKSVFNKH